MCMIAPNCHNNTQTTVETGNIGRTLDSGVVNNSVTKGNVYANILKNMQRRTPPPFTTRLT